MEYLQFVFTVLLFVQYTYGYRPDEAPPEKIKLTSEPKYYYPEEKSDHHYESQIDSSGPGVKYNSDSNVEHSTPNYDLYKPHDDHDLYGPSEEDSKYIPHSKTYSKYIIPKSSPSSAGEHKWEDKREEYHSDDTKMSEEIPRYGFTRQNPHHDQKHYGNEDVNDETKHHVEPQWDKKHPQPYEQGPNYRTHPSEKNGEYKHYEHDDKYPKTYPDHREEHESHHEKHPYPEHKDEPRIYHGRHNYPEHKEDSRIRHETHHYPEHKEDHRIHHRNRHYPEHKGDHSTHHGRHHHHPELREEYGNRYKKYPNPEYKEEYGNHHGNDPLRYQHWSDKEAVSFPTNNADKFIEELKKGKTHNIGNGPENDLKYPVHHGNKAGYVPHVDEFIKGHKTDSHKSPHNFDADKSHHKEHRHIDSSGKGHSFLKHYPHINKYHKEHHFKSFMNYKPYFNFGGHSYGWMYKPKADLYQELRKDLDIKMRLLKEHEQKLAELQKGHLEKYRALFEPHHAKKFFNHEVPKHVIPSVDYKHHSLTEQHEEKHGHISPSKHHSGYGDYDIKPDYSNHKPNPHPQHEIPHPHYEVPHPKHDSPNVESQHHNHDPHHYKDDYTP